MKKKKPGLKLTLIGYGLGVGKTRREALYDVTYELVELLSDHKDLGMLAIEMVAVTQLPKELEFLCSSIDSVLKTHCNSPLRARAVIVTELRRIARLRHEQIPHSMKNPLNESNSDRMIIGGVRTPIHLRMSQKEQKAYFKAMDEFRRQNGSVLGKP